MTYTSIIFLLWRSNVPFNSREAVSQALLWGDFSLAAFLRQILGLVFGIEGVAAFLLWLHDPVFFYPFSALFHAVSAFCNAGFALSTINLGLFRDDLTVNLIIAFSVILGGIGFGVLRELLGICTGGRMDRPLMRKTLADTLSENLTDAFAAPFFWLLMGGPVALWCYKAVSTTDSMLPFLLGRSLRELLAEVGLRPSQNNG
jgi:Trk-type K+ transport systems, membrane components